MKTMTSDAKRLARQEEVRLWLDAIGSFLQKVISTVAQQHIPVVWQNEVNSIAYTDGLSIYLGEAYFAEKIEDQILKRNFSGASGAVAILKAIALHELAHILWTCRPGNSTTFVPLVDKIRGWSSSRYGGYHAGNLVLHTSVSPQTVWNIVEDARIELRLLNRFRAVKPYLTEAVTATILTDKNALHQTGTQQAELNGNVWPLVYGRKYLPYSAILPFESAHEDLIAKNRANGLNPLSIDEVKSLIDEFITLDLLHNEADSDRAFVIIQWLTYHFDNLSELTFWQNDSGGYTNRVQVGDGNPPIPEFDQDAEIQKGRSNTVKKRQNSVENDRLDDTLEELEELQQDSDDDADEDGDTGNGGKSDTGKISGSDSEDSNSGADDADDANGAEASDADYSGQTGTDSGVSSPSPAQEALQKIKEAVDKANKPELDSASRKDVEAIADIRSEGTRPDLKPALAGATTGSVTPDMKISATTLTRAIQKLWSDSEPAWESGATTGRLNVNLAMKSEASVVPNIEIFDQWTDSGETNDFEVVVLVDQSSSMWSTCTNGLSIADNVSRATWVLRKMCEDLNIPVTVFGYSDKSRCLFRPGTRVSNTAYHQVPSNGSTNPLDALRWASSIFNASTARHKLLFSLTDGDWGAYRADQYKSPTLLMRSKGVQTFFGLMLAHSKAGMTEKYIRSNYANLYGHEHLLLIDNLKEFPKVVAKSISQLSTL